MSTAHWAPITLLIGSNVFMTAAWYGHLTSLGAAVIFYKPGAFS